MHSQFISPTIDRIYAFTIRSVMRLHNVEVTLLKTESKFVKRIIFIKARRRYCTAGAYDLNCNHDKAMSDHNNNDSPSGISVLLLPITTARYDTPPNRVNSESEGGQLPENASSESYPLESSDTQYDIHAHRNRWYR